MAPPKPKSAATKRARTEAGSSSVPAQPATETIPNPIPIVAADWTYNPRNRFLFKSDDAFRFYRGNICGNDRSIAFSYYFRQPRDNEKGWRISEMDYDCIKPNLDYLNAWGLFNCTQKYHTELIKYFYANLDIVWEDGIPRAESLVCGRPIVITMDRVCRELFLRNEGKQIYINRSWTKDSDIEPFEKYHEFFYCWRDYHLKQFTATELPAYHRFFFLIANNIIAPKKQIKTNVELREVFLLRCIIEKNPIINLAYIFFMHMDKAKHSSNYSLPYGNLISYLLAKDGIPPNVTIPGTTGYVEEPIDLMDHLPSCGWVVDERTEIITPDPDFLRNRYLHQPGAKVNQYAPVGQEPTGPLRGPNVGQQELDPAVVAYLEQYYGKFDTRITNLETNWNNWQQEDAKWKAEDAEWKQADAKWKEAELAHRAQHDAKIDKVETDVQTFWGSMQNEFKKLHVAIRKGKGKGSSSQAPHDEDSDSD